MWSGGATGGLPRASALSGPGTSLYLASGPGLHERGLTRVVHDGPGTYAAGQVRPDPPSAPDADIRDRRAADSGNHRDPGTPARVSAAASRAIGTFTQNTSCQPECSTSSPPPSGPIASPKPETPVHP